MQFANVRDLRLETNKVLKLSREDGPVVVTRRGQPIALLRTISKEDFDFQIGSLWSRLRQAAERSGFKPRDVARLIKEIRNLKR